MTGPPGWRKTQLSALKELGFKNHPLAPCVVLMYDLPSNDPSVVSRRSVSRGGNDSGSEPEKQELTGVVVIETDDLLMGGVGPKFDKALDQLQKRFTFGKWEELWDSHHDYGGRTLRQTKDYGFEISMTRYLKNRAREIVMHRGRCKNPKDLAHEGEITGMRGVCGSLNWAAREGMPQGAGDASLLSSTLPTPTIKDLQEANAALKRLLQNDVPVKIKPIPLDRLRLLMFADSSLGNASGGASQLARMTCACDKDLLEGKEADISILTWKSHKMSRAGANTLFCESNAMSEGLADC